MTSDHFVCRPNQQQQKKPKAATAKLSREEMESNA